MKKKSPKQIVALVCVAILVLLYIATLVFAILDFPGAKHLFAACLFSTIALPLLFWIYLWLYGRVTNKPTIADIFPQKEEDKDDTKDN